MQTGLLVDSSDNTGLVVLLRVQGGVQIELEALGDLVLELNDTAEDIGGRPGLGESDAILPVGVFRLEVTVDVLGLAVLGTSDLEGDTGRGAGLDLEGVAREVVVFSKQVVGGLAEILFAEISRRQFTFHWLKVSSQLTFQEGGTG